MNYFEQIEAMHQQVREYVESLEPDYKVTSIDGYFTTEYVPSGKFPLVPDLDKMPEYVLLKIQARFRVSAEYLGGVKRLSCEVNVMSNGQLFTGDRLVSR